VDGFVCFMMTAYVIGWLVAIMVIRVRAGVGVWHRLKVFGSDGFGPAWTLSAGTAALFWPITLAVWLARGRPEPRIVFNEKAVERRRRQAEF
jgi:hypothetical protein